jgi:hypothetical protein
MWSSGRRPTRVVKFPRAPAAGSAGDGRGVVQGCPRLDFDLGWGSGSTGELPRRHRAAAATVVRAPAR